MSQRANDLLLVIGDKNFSSWSMRPWLALKHSGLKFTEKQVVLDSPDATRKILKFSPTGKVPALIHGKTTIWDSMAICEYINELAPRANLLPANPQLRALARSYIAEMHSGFSDLRSQLSMDIRLKIKAYHLVPGTVSDIRRISHLWEKALKKSGGPFLFGGFTIADAFYAPVVLRFESYGIDLSSKFCQNYQKNILKNEHVKNWIEHAKREKLFRPKF